MNAKLCEQVPAEFMSASEKSAFFANPGEEEILRSFERRELPETGVVCRTNLFFGFFFDGTKNNYINAEKDLCHSNVARLYDAFPGQSVPDVTPTTAEWTAQDGDYGHFYRTYVPGVASPFPQIGDSGKGLALQLGAAGGRGGQARIIWAMMQAVNNVHRYLLGSVLYSPADILAMTKVLDLSAWHRKEMRHKGTPTLEGAEVGQALSTRQQLEKMLRKLHSAVSQHWRVNGCRPKKIHPAEVKTIHISVFGFSRGATQARAFTNWLISLCKLDAEICGRGELTLGGFQVQFDFLGLFDTVASVGIANSLGNRFWARIFDGHGGWADANENLRVPEDVPCLHLVAAHEIRRSFPLDSISVKGVLSENCEEIVIPGVHSDIGSGYSPKEQGRGLDEKGADMLARVPLLKMYKAARLAGVPFKLESAGESVKEKFTIHKRVIDGLNAYLSSCTVKEGSLTEIMREQAKYGMLYHRARCTKNGANSIEHCASFLRATNFDKNDLASAHEEIAVEIDAFEEMLNKGLLVSDGVQVPGFDNEKINEWKEIASWWRSTPTPSKEVLDFFDEFVHDSRAWFKISLGERDNEKDVLEDLERWSDAVTRYDNSANYEGRTQDLGLSPEQEQAARKYMRTKSIPRMKNQGRENWKIAGYLRYRKIYAGADEFLISQGAPFVPAGAPGVMLASASGRKIGFAEVGV